MAAASRAIADRRGAQLRPAPRAGLVDDARARACRPASPAASEPRAVQRRPPRARAALPSSQHTTRHARRARASACRAGRGRRRTASAPAASIAAAPGGVAGGAAHRVAVGDAAPRPAPGRGSRSRRSGRAPRPASSLGSRTRRRSALGRQRSSSATWLRMSSSVRSGRPRARRRSFCASSIWSTSSISFSASTSGERVGLQSTASAPEPGYQCPSASRNSRSATTTAEHDHGERIHRSRECTLTGRCRDDARRLHRRRPAHPDRPLRRRARRRPPRRPGRPRRSRAAVERNGVDPARIDDVYLGCANQAGEDNRNVARMAALLAGLPVERPGRDGQPALRLRASRRSTRRARAVKVGEGDLLLAGGVESMSRAPLVMLEARARLPARRRRRWHDTTLGWRFVNPRMAELHSTESMGETGENVAERYGVTREDQDAFALAVAPARGRRRRGAGASPTRSSPIEAPAAKRRDRSRSRPTRARAPTPRWRSSPSCAPVFREGGTVTAGNASTAQRRRRLPGARLRGAAPRSSAREPLARIVATGVAGVDPAYMGIGPVPARPARRSSAPA